MNILLWLLIGGVTGWLFSKLVRRQSREARTAYALLGALGSLGIALVWSQLSEPIISWFDAWLVGLALIGAVVAIAIGYGVMHYVGGKRTAAHD